MATEYSGEYRLVGMGDGMRRVALYDLERDDSVWVNGVGYDDEITDALGELQLGNLVSATVTDKGDENEFWNFLDVEPIEDTRLYYFETEGYAPGPTDEFWQEERDEGEPLFTAAWRDDDGEPLYEIHLQKQQLEAGDGTIDVFEQLQRGEMLTEPLFEGEGCVHLDEAERILVTELYSRPYLAMYLFPEHNSQYDDIYKALYESE